MHGAPRTPVLLIVLDGFGANPGKLHNAIAQADTPALDRYFSSHCHTLIDASGPAVGLPDGQMGNSEVGHMTIGSGIIVKQDLVLIDEAVHNRSFFANPVIKGAASGAAEAGKPLHIMGLVSDGGVHSHLRHLLALIKLCQSRGAKPVLHMFTDGRDTPPKSALKWLDDVESALRDAGGAIATISGRYYAMDRDKHWERTEQAWSAIVHNQGRRASTAREAIETAYQAGETDEFIKPVVLPDAQPFADPEFAFFFNFRKDRPRQLLSALCKPVFTEFERRDFTPVNFACMMEYDSWLGLPYAFRHDRPEITLSQIISDAGLQQLHCAETEKYAHVTFFFNGGRAESTPGERHDMVPSPRVATYDLQPEMSAATVANRVIDAIAEEKYAFIVVNLANGDMVGHTGIWEAALRAVETLDRETGRMLDAAGEHGYACILTADHGNCDEMVDSITGEPHTQHTVYPVPCLIVDENQWKLSTRGGLHSIAPTVLHLMGLPKPAAMAGESLLLQPLRGNGLT